MKADPTTYRHTPAGRELFVALLPSMIGRGNVVTFPPGLHNATRTVSLCSKICALARTAKRNAERACSDPTWNYIADEKRDERNDQRILETVKLLGPGWGVKLSGDPRGATVKIETPDGRTDDWGGVGICVPGS